MEPGETTTWRFLFGFYQLEEAVAIANAQGISYNPAELESLRGRISEAISAVSVLKSRAGVVPKIVDVPASYRDHLGKLETEPTFKELVTGMKSWAWKLVELGSLRTFQPSVNWGYVERLVKRAPKESDEASVLDFCLPLAGTGTPQRVVVSFNPTANTYSIVSEHLDLRIVGQVQGEDPTTKKEVLWVRNRVRPSDDHHRSLSRHVPGEERIPPRSCTPGGRTQADSSSRCRSGHISNDRGRWPGLLYNRRHVVAATSVSLRFPVSRGGQHHQTAPADGLDNPRGGPSFGTLEWVSRLGLGRASWGTTPDQVGPDLPVPTIPNALEPEFIDIGCGCRGDTDTRCGPPKVEDNRCNLPLTSSSDRPARPHRQIEDSAPGFGDRPVNPFSRSKSETHLGVGHALGYRDWPVHERAPIAASLEPLSSLKPSMEPPTEHGHGPRDEEVGAELQHRAQAPSSLQGATEQRG